MKYQDALERAEWAARITQTQDIEPASVVGSDIDALLLKGEYRVASDYLWKPRTCLLFLDGVFSRKFTNSPCLGPLPRQPGAISLASRERLEALIVRDSGELADAVILPDAASEQ